MKTWKCMLVSALALIALGGLIALAIVYSGAYNVAATHPHYPLEAWLFKTVRARSVDVRSDEIDVPGNLDSPERIEAGLRLYEEHCVHCHLRPGMEPTAVHRGLNPEPPRLTEWSNPPGAAFWAIKHGIRSTGMPAWGPTHEDPAIWDIVAFQRQLPNLDAPEYEAMLREAESRSSAPSTQGHPGGE